MVRAFPMNMPGCAASAASRSSHQVPVVVQVALVGVELTGNGDNALGATLTARVQKK
jgi:hypothetical protein